MGFGIFFLVRNSTIGFRRKERNTARENGIKTGFEYFKKTPIINSEIIPKKNAIILPSFTLLKIILNYIEIVKN